MADSCCCLKGSFRGHSWDFSPNMILFSNWDAIQNKIWNFHIFLPCFIYSKRLIASAHQSTCFIANWINHGRMISLWNCSWVHEFGQLPIVCLPLSLPEKFGIAALCRVQLHFTKHYDYLSTFTTSYFLDYSSSFHAS